MLAKIIHFFSPPEFEGDEAKTRAARLLNVIALSSILAVVSIAFFLPASRLGLTFFTTLFLLGVWLAARRGYVRAASTAMVIGIAVILAISTFTGGGIRSVGFNAFAVLILFAGLLLGGKAAIGVTIFSILYGLFLYEAGVRGWLASLYEPQVVTHWIAGSVFFVMTGAMLTLALQMIDRAMKQAKSAMDELEQVSGGYYSLFDNSPIGIYRSSVDGKMIEANQALMRFNGYEDKDEFLKSVTDIATEWYVEPGRREIFQREMEERGRVTNFESEVYRHKTRERVWITENARAVRDSKGRVLYYEGTVEDITPRKQTESELDFLYNLALSFARGKDLIGVLSTLHWEVLKVVPVDALFVAMYDESADVVDYPVFSIGGESKKYPSHRLSDRQGLTRRVILGGETIYSQDVRADRNEAQFLPTGESALPLRTFLGIPLTIGDKVIGMLSVQSGKVNAYSPDQIRLMENMAFQAALAIDKAHLLDRLKQELVEREKIENDLIRRADEMSLLYQISRVLISGEDLSHILRNFVKELKRVMIVDSFHVGFYDAPTGLFTYSLFLDFDEDLQLPPRSLREEPGLTGEVISLKSTVYLPDVMDAETQQQHKVVVIKHANIRSYIGIPLMLQDRVIGVMSVQAVQTDAYTLDQIRLLETLAVQVASTTEKNRLFEQLKTELVERTKAEADLRQREAMLGAVTFAAEQFLKSSDWRVNIEAVLENLGRTINVSHCYLFEHHTGVNGQALSSLRYEWAAPGFTSSVNDSMYQAHLIRGEPGTTDEILQKGDVLAAASSTFPSKEKERLNALGIRALIEAPVFVNGYWWGTIGVDDMTKEREWSSAETDVIRAAANVLEAAIRRQLDETALQSELSERRIVEANLRQRESILEVVAESASRLLKSPDWESEIETLLADLGEVIHASHAYLFENHLKDDGAAVTSLRYEWTAPDHPNDLEGTLYQNVLLKNANYDFWHQALSSGSPFIGDRLRLTEDELGMFTARGIKALLDVPIFVDGEWWGIIGFDDMDESRIWSNSEVDALLVAANILGRAIERQAADAELRTREQKYRVLYEMAEKQTQELALLSHVRSVMSQELDLSSLFRRVVEAVAESFGYGLVSIYLLEKGELIFQHQVGYDRVISRIPIEQGISGRVARTGKPVFVEDVRTDPDFLGDTADFVSEICVPLLDEGNVVGVLNVESTQGIKLTETDFKLLDALSQHIGIAISRARLYTNVQNELEARKLSEIEREKLIAELAAKNAELERFTYTVSHDLKSPLFTIRGFLGYLEKDMVDGDHARFKADAQRIADATEKMQQLLNDLLELSRVGRMMNEPAPINMNELVREVLDLVEGRIQERGATVQVQEDLPSVFADRQRISEVLQNLVDNAIKFTGDQPDPRVEIGQAGEENGMPIFFVRDNGIGISQDHFERVFGLFNKLDSKTEGTGVGLSLVKRIIEFHGGRIWVESEPGNGSTFFFTLPSQPVSDSVI